MIVLGYVFDRNFMGGRMPLRLSLRKCCDRNAKIRCIGTMGMGVIVFSYLCTEKRKFVCLFAVFSSYNSWVSDRSPDTSLDPEES